MSLMEFCEIRDGVLVPAYGRQVESFRTVRIVSIHD